MMLLVTLCAELSILRLVEARVCCNPIKLKIKCKKKWDFVSNYARHLLYKWIFVLVVTDDEAVSSLFSNLSFVDFTGSSAGISIFFISVLVIGISLFSTGIYIIKREQEKRELNL